MACLRLSHLCLERATPPLALAQESRPPSARFSPCSLQKGRSHAGHVLMADSRVTGPGQGWERAMATDLCPVSPRCHPQAPGLLQPPILHQAVSGLNFFPLPGHPSHRHTLHREPALPPSCLSPCPGGQERAEPPNPGSRGRSWFCSRVGVWGLGCPRHHGRVQKTSEEGCRKGLDGQWPVCLSQALGSARRLSPQDAKGAATCVLLGGTCGWWPWCVLGKAIVPLPD